MSVKTLKAFAVIGEGYSDSADELEVASTDGVQLGVFTTIPAATERLEFDGEQVLAVVILAASDFERITAEREALQLRLNVADQRIDELTQARDSERLNLIAYGRSNGLDEASTVCTRMAQGAYFPPGSRFKYFTPKTQARLGNLLIEAANAIASLPDGPYDRFKTRQQKTAEKSATV